MFKMQLVLRSRLASKQYLVNEIVPHLDTPYPKPSKFVNPETKPAIDAMLTTRPPIPPYN